MRTQYADVFDTEKAGVLPAHSKNEHAINLDGNQPPFGPLYNLSTKELEVLRTYLDSSLKKGWIRRSISPAGAPVLFTPKKDGGLRLYVAYRVRRNRPPTLKQPGRWRPSKVSALITIILGGIIGMIWHGAITA